MNVNSRINFGNKNYKKLSQKLTKISRNIFETKIRLYEPTKINKNQRVVLFFAPNEMQQAAFEGAKQNEILRKTINMYIRLIRNEAKGNAIAGRLVVDGRWFCDTLERVGYEILALCYHIAVTHSPRFKRLLPIVQNVPNRSGIRIHRGSKPEHSTGCILVPAEKEKELTNLILKAQHEHEEIILEVSDFRAGTEYGYNTPCERELQKR